VNFNPLLKSTDLNALGNCLQANAVLWSLASMQLRKDRKTFLVQIKQNEYKQHLKQKWLKEVL
jgi:hypothetical protein